MNYKQISKMTIYSIIMGVFSIVGITCFAISFPDWAKYGFDSLTDGLHFNKDKIIPISVEELRAWSMASLVVCTLLTGLNIWEIKKMENINYKKYFIASLGFFTWLMLPCTIYIGLRDKLYSQFLKHISQNRLEKSPISFLIVKSGLSNNHKKDKIFWNSIFAFFVFLVTFVGFIFCILLAENLYGIKVIHKIDENSLSPFWKIEDYYSRIKATEVFSTLAFFTQLSNIACFIFMFSFLLFHKKIIFKNNTIMIAISSYIFIVSIIFWGYLFPQSLTNNTYVVNFQWAKTTWLHAVTPILFICFLFTSIFTSKLVPTNFKKIIGGSLIFPISYGIFIYSLPFFTRFSVYGGLTNMNPHMSTTIGMINENGDPITTNGNPLMAFGIIGLLGLFVLVIYGFWSFVYLINKRSEIKDNIQDFRSF